MTTTIPAPTPANTSAATAAAAVATSSLSAPGTLEPSPTPLIMRDGESWLLFRWYPDSLFLVRPDGSDRTRLDLGVRGTPMAPSWAPDGEGIVFVIRDGDEVGVIWTARADGSDAQLFYSGESGCDDEVFHPVWSPDGQQLAVICYSIVDDKSVSSVSLVDAVSKVRTELVSVTWPEFIDNPPSWSPDGSMLAFDILTWDPTDTFVTGSTLATVPATGGRVRRLTEPSLFGAHADWSPDGSLLAFNTYDTGNMHGIEEPSNVYTITPDGSDLTQLSTASTDGFMRLGQPFWSLDGDRIWVSVGRDWEKDSGGNFKNTLAWVDAATGEFHEIGTEGKVFRERPLP